MSEVVCRHGKEGLGVDGELLTDLNSKSLIETVDLGVELIVGRCCSSRG
jgi:hypothetical protein